jgi:DNA-binding SARP family transcriptional activator
MTPTSPEVALGEPAGDAFIAAWRQWDAVALSQACVARGALQPSDDPELAYWRAMADFIVEGADALTWLDRAWRGFRASGRGEQAAVVANAALVLCLLDSGAMSQLDEWHLRVEAGTPADVGVPLSNLWWRLGLLARVSLGKADSEGAAQAAAGLLNDLQPLKADLSTHERLLVAMVLIEYDFAVTRFDQIDYLANLVEHPALFDLAPPALRARWVCTHGFALYHVGDHERAERAWRRALPMAHEAGPGSLLGLKLTIALARLLLDRGRVEEADRVIKAVDPRWGGGRTLQLVELQQTRARVQLSRGQPAGALATLDEADRLAAEAGLSQSENGGRLTDRAQVYIALDRGDDAQAVFTRMAGEQSGRSGQVSISLQHLLRAWMNRVADPAGSRQDLAKGLAVAQAVRYTMFFRLLPGMAASVCALALRSDIAPQFVDEVIRSRQLPAPADADGRWPWPLWLVLLGGFEMRRDGKLEPSSPKTQQKPLELLRLLACARNLSVGAQAVTAALWPDADDAAARKSLEMAVLRLRRLLGDATLLRVSDGRVALDAERASSDVQQRRRLIEQIESLAMRSSGPDAGHTLQAECLDLLERVISLSRGDLLPGLAPAPWLEAERKQCRDDTVRAALAAATAMERLHVGPAERELLETALRIEPLAESLVRRLMHAHERAGQRGDALRVFEGYRQQLQDRGAKPGEQLDAQWRALMAQPLQAVKGSASST